MKRMTGIIPFVSLHSGQHKDLLHSDATYKADIADGINRLDSIVSSLMNSIDFQAEGIKSHIEDWSQLNFEKVKIELGI